MESINLSVMIMFISFINPITGLCDIEMNECNCYADGMEVYLTCDIFPQEDFEDSIFTVSIGLLEETLGNIFEYRQRKWKNLEEIYDMYGNKYNCWGGICRKNQLNTTPRKQLIPILSKGQIDLVTSSAGATGDIPLKTTNIYYIQTETSFQPPPSTTSTTITLYSSQQPTSTTTTIMTTTTSTKNSDNNDETDNGIIMTKDMTTKQSYDNERSVPNTNTSTMQMFIKYKIGFFILLSIFSLFITFILILCIFNQCKQFNMRRRMRRRRPRNNIYEEPEEPFEMAELPNRAEL
jgi:hypothetical protein